MFVARVIVVAPKLVVVKNATLDGLGLKTSCVFFRRTSTFAGFCRHAIVFPWTRIVSCYIAMFVARVVVVAPKFVVVNEACFDARFDHKTSCVFFLRASTFARFCRHAIVFPWTCIVSCCIAMRVARVVVVTVKFVWVDDATFNGRKCGTLGVGVGRAGTLARFS